MKKDGRLQLRISADLKRRMEKYAERKHTTLAELVTRFFVRVLEEEKRAQEALDAEQI